eukprot:6179816-Pleurochrysis_carterae.AAC.3
MRMHAHGRRFAPRVRAHTQCPRHLFSLLKQLHLFALLFLSVFVCVSPPPAVFHTKVEPTRPHTPARLPYPLTPCSACARAQVFFVVGRADGVPTEYSPEQVHLRVHASVLAVSRWAAAPVTVLRSQNAT